MGGPEGPLHQQGAAVSRSTTSALVAAALALTAAAWLVWRWASASPDGTAGQPETAMAPRAPAPAVAPQHPAPPSGPDVAIGEYRADAANLPSTRSPLAVQIPALREAAQGGNATAACRLAEIGMMCARVQGVAPDMAVSAEFRREQEQWIRQQYADVSLEAVPESLRDHARRRLDSDAVAQIELAENLGAWARRCAGAPAPAPEDALAFLRQAALAGEPRSMARYAYGEWLVGFVGSAAAARPGTPGHGFAWSRSPAFDQWRREARAVQRAGFERGDPEMLQMNLLPGLGDLLAQVGVDDPIDDAAALRAYAALVTDRTPESTAALGLSPEQAAEADRRADEWAARGRERGRSVDAALLALHESSGVPECE